MRHVFEVITALLVGVVLLMAALPAQSEELSRRDFAAKLGESVAHYGAAKGEGYCTATKIGEREWLTAGHCISMDTRLETNGGQYLFPRSITLSVSEKADGRRVEDWAILNVAQYTPQIPILGLACGSEIHQGQGVAYFGFPAGVEKGYFEGYISSVHKARSRGNQADWIIDIPVAGGASGSAVVDRGTMQVIGVVTEGIWSGRTGFYLAAAESVQNIDHCKTWNERMKHYDELGDDGTFLPHVPGKPATSPDEPVDHT